MRQLLCETCGKDKVAGVRIVYPAAGPDPAEYERVKWGVALKPVDQELRTIRYNGVPERLPMTEWTCDRCSASILPGSRVCAWSVWTARQSEPPEWESSYLAEPQ